MLFLVLDFYRYHYDFNAFAGNKSSFQSCLPNFNSRAITSERDITYTQVLGIKLTLQQTSVTLIHGYIFERYLDPCNFPRRFLIFTGQGLWIANLRSNWTSVVFTKKKNERTVSATATRKISSYGCNFSLSPPKYRQSLRTYLGLVDPCLHKFLHLTSPSY